MSEGMRMTGRKLAWRQLLTDPPSSWTRLPVVVRGVGDEVLRHLDVTAEIDCGSEPVEDVVLRLIAAHPRERKMVRSALRQLIGARFLVIETRGASKFLVGSLPDISVGAPRREEQKSDPPQPQPDANGSATITDESAKDPPTPPVPIAHGHPMFPSNHAKTQDLGPTEKRREEKSKEEERETPSGGPRFAFVTALHADYRAGFPQHLPGVRLPTTGAEAANGVWHPVWEKLAVRIEDQAAHEGCDVHEIKDRVMRAFWADKKAKKQGYPPSFIVAGIKAYAQRARHLTGFQVTSGSQVAMETYDSTSEGKAATDAR